MNKCQLKFFWGKTALNNSIYFVQLGQNIRNGGDILENRRTPTDKVREILVRCPKLNIIREEGMAIITQISITRDEGVCVLGVGVQS